MFVKKLVEKASKKVIKKLFKAITNSSFFFFLVCVLVSFLCSPLNLSMS